MKAPHGVRLRATLAATATVAVALVVVSVVLTTVLYHSVAGTAQAESARKASAAAGRIRDGVAVAPDTAAAPSGTVFRLGSLQPAVCGDVRVAAGGQGAWKSTASYSVVSVALQRTGAPVTVQARTSLAPANTAMSTLWSLLLPGVPALLALVALLTWIAVGRALKPVSAIQAKLTDITAHDLHQRVPEPKSTDEIGALARTVNATLDRLQSAVERHKRFVADAAHELRSPLAILRARLELKAPPDLARQSLTEVTRLESLTADLLLLARLDAGEPLRHQEVDLGQVTAEEAARTRPRSQVRVDLHVADDILVQGSSDQLRRMVGNLVDNAVRHADTSVTVRLTGEGGEGGDGGGLAVLEVIDDGPGIPEEQREAVFDRFTRLDEARDRDHGGSGLGLAIAREITTAHGGDLTVLSRADERRGARLRAVLPRLPPPGVRVNGHFTEPRRSARRR